MFVCVCVHVYDIVYVHSVWYVVCNCLRLTIHHRDGGFHIFFTLSSQETCSLFCSEKRGKLFRFSKNAFDKCFLSLSFTHWTCITNFLERDCVGGWMGNKKPHICQVEKQSRQIALTCQRVWHHQVPPWENEKLCTHTKHSIPANVFLFFVFKQFDIHLFSRVY